MRFVVDTLLDFASVTEDKTSETVDLDTIVNLSVQIVWTSGTAAATVKVQVSNDDINWVDLGTATINNNNGNSMVTLANNPYKSMRVFADYSSGTIDTLKVIYSGKGY